MSHTFERFRAQLQKFGKYTGYALSRSREVYDPKFKLARELGHVLRAVYTLTFACLDVGLDSLAQSLYMPQLLMENRILRLGFPESVDGLFVHAHLNFVATNYCDFGEESYLEHLCRDVVRKAECALLEEVFYSEDGVLAKKEIVLARDMVTPLLQSSGVRTAKDEAKDEVEEEVEERVLEEEVVVERVVDRDPAWVIQISALQYLQSPPNIQRVIREKFSAKWGTQKSFDTCVEMLHVSKSGDVAALKSLLSK